MKSEALKTFISGLKTFIITIVICYLSIYLLLHLFLQVALRTSANFPDIKLYKLSKFSEHKICSPYGFLYKKYIYAKNLTLKYNILISSYESQKIAGDALALGEFVSHRDKVCKAIRKIQAYCVEFRIAC